MFSQNIVKKVPSFGRPSFTLNMDFIRLYTCAMRYSESTKCIFKVAKGVFGGRTLRFSSGWKNETQIITGKAKPDFYSPV